MSLGYGDDGFGVGDSPRPGERAEDPRYTPPPSRMTDVEYLAQVRKWGEVAKSRKAARARQEGFSDGK